MTATTTYTCDHCGAKDTEESDHAQGGSMKVSDIRTESYRVSGDYRISRHLCKKCRKKVEEKFTQLKTFIETGN